MPQKDKTTPSTAVQIIWQWVSYSLWELTLIALTILLTSTLTYFFINKEPGDYQFIIYVLATLACLLPAAFFAERTYAKQEPEQKQGFAAVVMVLNAVLVFLASIAALIIAAISALSILVQGDSSEAIVITIIASLILTLLGAKLFVRILNPGKLRKFTKHFALIVSIAAAATVIASCVGPLRALTATRNDRLIEENLSSISYAVENYTYDKDKLPASLKDIKIKKTDYNEDALKLLDKNVVTYRANTKTPKTRVSEDKDYSRNELTTSTNTAHYYQLCVEYDHVRGNGKIQKDLYGAMDDHPAGKVCYDGDATTYDSTIIKIY